MKSRIGHKSSRLLNDSLAWDYSEWTFGWDVKIRSSLATLEWAIPNVMLRGHFDDDSKGALIFMPVPVGLQTFSFVPFIDAHYYL